MNPDRREEFFYETISKTKAKLVIPIHWDNFFRGLYKTTKGMPRVFERTENAFLYLVNYCEREGVDTLIQLPRTSITL
ncbi:MAG: hypothetical protein SPI59_01425 [Finegoldia sp.]|nr:hypothetical protein [Finegoldia sp.]